ncbi:MAG: hypothetical protein WC662_04540 [Candidatus Paceibacterota bacterium]|jgi:D-glycerate 3-kinase
MDERIEKLYLPIFNEINNWKLNSIKKTFVVGINGSQGIGKTTLCSFLVKMFEEKNLKAVSISIDDFYLTLNEQIELYKIDNKYLKERAWPGTHDIKLGEKILFDLINSSGKVKIPIYDKSLHKGKGDRLKEEEWKIIETPVDVILLEGWMLGFTEKTDIKDPHLNFINQKLNEYHAWYKFIDAFVFLIPENINYIVDWRVEAEENMKKSGKSGMTEEEIRQYISNFIIAYETYLPNLKPPINGPVLKIKIGKNRMPIDDFLKS